ncbi:MAG: hypothetical protein U9N35_07405 [Euryarchaeota archaeon]|nr:hypothetical protein [Euryarchaeota archaeon]
MFGLYESWITKVLWAGYMDSGGPGVGTLFGVGISEFPILVFFWHPIMSFLLPILVFEILTKKVITGHESVLRKTTRKTVLITLFLLSTSTFIANGNAFDPVSSNLSLIGTLLIVFGFYHVSKNADIRSLKLGKKGIIFLTAYLALLYSITFFFLLPDRIPTTITPYVTILAFYVIPIMVILRSNKNPAEMKTLEGNFYSIKDIRKFAIILGITVNIACFVPTISMGVLAVTYGSLLVIGTALFAVVIYKLHRSSSRSLMETFKTVKKEKYA